MKPLILLLCAALSSTACSKEENMEHTRPGYDSMGMPIAEHPPEVRINPNRKNRYEVTVDFKDAPGGFEFIKGTELYQAKNCEYTTARFQGATAYPKLYHKVKFTKKQDTVYSAIFYDDTPLDEDYYGQGVCHWEVFSFYLTFRARTDSKIDTNFSFSIINGKEILELSSPDAKLEKTRYFFKESYPNRKYLIPDDELHLHAEIFPKDIAERQLDIKELFPVKVTIRRL